RPASRPEPLPPRAVPGTAGAGRRAALADSRVLLAMPRLTFPVAPPGLAVSAWVGLDGQTTAALHAGGQPVPAPLRARALLDTCSDVTAVATHVLRQLAVAPVTAATTYPAAGAVAVSLYGVSLSITDPSQPGPPKLTRTALLVSELTAV